MLFFFQGIYIREASLFLCHVFTNAEGGQTDPHRWEKKTGLCLGAKECAQLERTTEVHHAANLV